jgi:hypothetical protein
MQSIATGLHLLIVFFPSGRVSAGRFKKMLIYLYSNPAIENLQLNEFYTEPPL